MITRACSVNRSAVLIVSAFVILAAGCLAERRGLTLTEVGKRQVELMLAETAGRRITLGNGYKLTVRTSTGYVNRVELGVFDDSLGSGEFVMVWEQNGYTGSPVAEPFPSGQQGTVPGIKVADNFFGEIDDYPSEIRLSGQQNRVSNPILSCRSSRSTRSTTWSASVCRRRINRNRAGRLRRTAGRSRTRPARCRSSGSGVETARWTPIIRTIGCSRWRRGACRRRRRDHRGRRWALTPPPLEDAFA